ncbi:MAG: replication restart helicase PriA [Flavobacteriales bacterium]
MKFADIILPLPLSTVYTYEVPQQFLGVKIGSRVIVQFGQKKIYTALIYRLHDSEPKTYRAKPIIEVLDSEPFISDKQIELWNWLADYYCCQLGDVMNAALPSTFKLSSETVLIRTELNYEEKQLTDNEFLLIDAFDIQSSLSLKEVAEILNQKTIFPTINSLISKQLITSVEEVNDKYKPKIVRYVTLKVQHPYELISTKAHKQKLLLDTYFKLSNQQNDSAVSFSKLINHSKASHSSLKNLVEKNIFKILYIQESRLKHYTYDHLLNFDLSDKQQLALESIIEQFKNKDVVLLNGVTSSGKTEIFVKLIRQFVKTGQQTLYLLPEIALTTQLINRLRQHFGDDVGVYHSKFSNNERAEIWKEVQQGKKYKIIIGTRSSIFLPFSKLGLIIVDEEHEVTFKQQHPSPRYNARDTAIKYAQILQSKVLLASATPAIDSYFNTTTQKYGLVELKERYSGIEMPEIHIEDIKYVTHRKLMKGAFSPFLLQEIQTALDEKNQVILFQNRRGFAPISECNSCGWTAKCNSCDVSLTYHKFQNVLKCHYCGYSEHTVKKCKSCGSIDLKIKGFGTEKIEEELEAIFKDAVIKRLDLDTTSKKYAYEEIITDFEDEKIDILIGTQMVTKGLNFNKVSLVGVLNANSLLNFPDFRSYERAFQLMTQVSGRAGRKYKQGKVVIQTYSPEHPIIESVKNNNYTQMFNTELLERKQFNYPPYVKLISIIVSHKDFNKTNLAARDLAIHLRQAFTTVLGPEYPSVSRIKNKYLKSILIKLESDYSLKKSKTHILSLVQSMNQISQYKSVRFTIDVDPL